MHTQDQMGHWQTLSPAKIWNTKRDLTLIYCMHKQMVNLIWVHTWTLIYVPMKLDDTSHIVIQHFYSYWCWDPLCGYDSSLQAGKETQAKAQPYHSHHSYVDFFTLLLRFRISLPGMQPWAIYFIQTIHLYFSGLTVPQTGPAFLKFHSITPLPRTNMF